MDTMLCKLEDGKSNISDELRQSDTSSSGSKSDLCSDNYLLMDVRVLVSDVASQVENGAKATCPSDSSISLLTVGSSKGDSPMYPQFSLSCLDTSQDSASCTEGDNDNAVSSSSPACPMFHETKLPAAKALETGSTEEVETSRKRKLEESETPEGSHFEDDEMRMDVQMCINRMLDETEQTASVELESERKDSDLNLSSDVPIGISSSSLMDVAAPETFASGTSDAGQTTSFSHSSSLSTTSPSCKHLSAAAYSPITPSASCSSESLSSTEYCGVSPTTPTSTVVLTRSAIDVSSQQIADKTSPPSQMHTIMSVADKSTTVLTTADVHSSSTAIDTATSSLSADSTVRSVGTAVSPTAKVAAAIIREKSSSPTTTSEVTNAEVDTTANADLDHAVGSRSPVSTSASDVDTATTATHTVIAIDDDTDACNEVNPSVAMHSETTVHSTLPTADVSINATVSSAVAKATVNLTTVAMETKTTTNSSAQLPADGNTSAAANVATTAVPNDVATTTVTNDLATTAITITADVETAIDNVANANVKHTTEISDIPTAVSAQSDGRATTDFVAEAVAGASPSSTHVKVLSGDEIVEACIVALKLCVQRYPLHYKSYFRLSKTYLHDRKRKVSS